MGEEFSGVRVRLSVIQYEEERVERTATLLKAPPLGAQTALAIRILPPFRWFPHKRSSVMTTAGDTAVVQGLFSPVNPVE